MQDWKSTLEFEIFFNLGGDPVFKNICLSRGECHRCDVDNDYYYVFHRKEWVWQDVTFELEHSPTRTLEAFGHREKVTIGHVELNFCDSAILDKNQFYEDLEIKLSEVEEELVGLWVLVLKIILVPLQQFLVSNGCLWCGSKCPRVYDPAASKRVIFIITILNIVFISITLVINIFLKLSKT